MPWKMESQQGQGNGLDVKHSSTEHPLPSPSPLRSLARGFVHGDKAVQRSSRNDGPFAYDSAFGRRQQKVSHMADPWSFCFISAVGEDLLRPICLLSAKLSQESEESPPQTGEAMARASFPEKPYISKVSCS
ncbi:hypothetical protein LA080_005436 [Diaporthe eres]|nr:hypothetical protein LA080_005436 [Diaporthe eres]